MFRNFSIGARFFLLLALMVVFLIVTGFLFLGAIRDITDYGVSETQDVMLADQKDKISVAVKSMALSLGEQIESIPGEEERIKFIRKSVDPIRFEEDKSGYFFVYEGTVAVAMPPKKALEGKDLSGVRDDNGVYLIQELRDVAQSGGGFVRYVFDKPGAGVQPKLSYSMMIPGTRMWIGTGVYLDNIDKEKARISGNMNSSANSTTLKIVAGAGAVFLLFILPLSLYLIKTIVSPLKDSTEAAAKVAEGDLDVKLEPVGSNEISTLQTALNTMVETLAQNLANIEAKEAEAQEQARAAGEAAREADKARMKAEGAKREGMLAAADKLQGVIERISSAAQDVSSGTDEILQGTRFQKERVAETATAMEEMNATVLEVARNAAETDEGTTHTRKRAGEGAEVVQKSIKAMAEIEERTESLKQVMQKLDSQAVEIGNVMSVINDIADQTNLLALNAAIEAARAGDAGRGFAVVADEVRTLADKTRGAPDEVEKSILSIQALARENVKEMDEASGAVNTATELSRSSGDVLTEIVELAGRAADQVRSIATAAEEQSATSEEINRSVGEIDSMTEENARNSTHAAEGAKALSAEVDELVSLVEELRGE